MHNVIAWSSFFVCGCYFYECIFYFPQRLVIEEYYLPRSSDYDDCSPLKIAVLSDLHVGRLSLTSINLRTSLIVSVPRGQIWC